MVMKQPHWWGEVFEKPIRIGADGPEVGVTLMRKCRRCGMPQVVERIVDGSPVIADGQDDGPCHIQDR
jgi:hypothetical protein